MMKKVVLWLKALGAGFLIALSAAFLLIIGLTAYEGRYANQVTESNHAMQEALAGLDNEVGNGAASADAASAQRLTLALDKLRAAAVQRKEIGAPSWHGKHYNTVEEADYMLMAAKAYEARQWTQGLDDLNRMLDLTADDARKDAKQDAGAAGALVLIFIAATWFAHGRLKRRDP